MSATLELGRPKMKKETKYNFFPSDRKKVAEQIQKPILVQALKQMLLIRNFELRGEAAYQQGKVGGFYHSYMGQEAIQVGCVLACGRKHWYTTTYRCHALAALMGATPNEMMAELYGRTTGNAQGRGGSMHLYAEHMLGGYGIVGGHVPVATGAAFSVKYQNQKDLISICFMGEGAVVQGAVHESLNLAALWSLPCMYVIENNLWGMGTAVSRAVAVEPIAESMAKAYGIQSYTLNGMDFFNCYAGFQHAYREMLQTGRPVLIEAVAERFRGHSISDPAVYRTKEELQKAMEHDPILILKTTLIEMGMLTEEEFKELDKQQKELVLAAMKFAEESPWPDPIILEQGVFAPEEGGPNANR